MCNLFPSRLIFFAADLAALLLLAQHHIPGAKLVEESRREAVIVLPQTAAKDSSLGVFLSELDHRLSELGISSYGLSDSTLEEVRCTVNDSSPVHVLHKDKFLPRCSFHLKLLLVPFSKSINK